jgi:sirohydrochlorin ferrochelatase
MELMALTLLAHGSPDSRHAHSVDGLVTRLRGNGVRAQAAYLDHHGPTPRDAAVSLRAAGDPETTVVPLLVSPAYHARVDVPKAVTAMQAANPDLEVSVAEPVGMHTLLLAAAAELVTRSGMKLGSRTGIILTATGSRDLRAVNAMESLLRGRGTALAEQLGARAVRAAYLDGGRPFGRIRTLMRCVDGCSSFVAIPMVIADGILRDRIVAAAGRFDTPVTPGALADTDALADLAALRAGADWAGPVGGQPTARG